MFKYALTQIAVVTVWSFIAAFLLLPLAMTLRCLYLGHEIGAGTWCIAWLLELKLILDAKLWAVAGTLFLGNELTRLIKDNYILSRAV